MNPLMLARMMLLPPSRYLGQPIVTCPRCKERVPNYWMMGKEPDDNCGTCEGEINHGSPLPDEVKAKIRSEIVGDEWFSDTAVCSDCGETFKKDPHLWIMGKCKKCLLKPVPLKPVPENEKISEVLEFTFEGLFSRESEED